MTIDPTTKVNVVLTMYNYLEDILAEAPVDFDGEDVTPAVSELFSVNLRQQKLDKVTADLCHCSDIPVETSEMPHCWQLEETGEIGAIYESYNPSSIDCWIRRIR